VEVKPKREVELVNDILKNLVHIFERELDHSVSPVHRDSSNRRYDNNRDNYNNVVNQSLAVNNTVKDPGHNADDVSRNLVALHHLEVLPRNNITFLNDGKKRRRNKSQTVEGGRDVQRSDADASKKGKNKVKLFIKEKQIKIIEDQEVSGQAFLKGGECQGWTKEQTLSLSSMNTQKILKLCVRYGLREQVEVRAFNNFEVVGDRPSAFTSDQEVSKNNHSEDYITIYGILFLEQNSSPFWNSGKVHGTADSVVVRSPQLSYSQDMVKLVFELKKKVEDGHKHQAIAKLIASNMFSSLKPVVMLTDFLTFKFYWIAPSQYLRLSGRSSVSSSFARALLVPDRAINYMTPENLNKLPLDERRDVISQITIISEDGGDDIANLDEFIDEMGP
ncbi:6336_t:CDS:2, partial [Acaulospora morrowiae]